MGALFNGHGQWADQPAVSNSPSKAMKGHAFGLVGSPAP